MSDEQQQKLTQLELTLDLNMAACQLKLKNYLKAIDHCKMALQIEPQHPKAFFRIGQAHLEMGNLAEATQHFKKVAELDPRNADAVKQLGEIRRLEAQQRDQEKQFAKAMAARMAGHRDSAEPPCNSSCP
jgi:FK506-binding protein 4/5